MYICVIYEYIYIYIYFIKYYLIKQLRDKAFNIVKNPKYDEYNRRIASRIYNFFYKQTAGGSVKGEIMSNQRLAEGLHKRLIRKCKKRRVHSSFVEKIWYVDLADMQLTSKFNKRFRFLFCVINSCSIYAGKKLITIELLIALSSYC